MGGRSAGEEGAPIHADHASFERYERHGRRAFPIPESLHLPATGREVAQFVALRAAACVGAEYANLALLNPATHSLRVFHDTFLEADIADRYTDLPVDAPYPISAAARTGRAILLPDLEAYRYQFP